MKSWISSSPGLCIPAQRVLTGDRYTPSMHTDYLKSPLVASWLLALLTLGIAAGVTTLSSWIGLALLGVVPTVVLLRLWRVPALTTSQRIQEARR